jgi:hypothetical protein
MTTEPPNSRAWTRWLITRRAIKRLTALITLLVLLLLGAYWYMIALPGESYRGPLAALSDRETALGESLERDITMLAHEFGPRNLYEPQRLEQAANWLEAELAATGCVVTRQVFEVTHEEDGIQAAPCWNIIGEIPGAQRGAEIVVVGGHYDSFLNSPGANDNASGTAAVLALARALAGSSPSRTLRFALFTNEEPPFFRTESMGSLVYARACRAKGENLVAMLSLETIGFYSDEPGSQQYPEPFDKLYPDTGNFIGFVANTRSRAMLHDVVAAFREKARFPSEGGALPGSIAGIGWSDHWAFWECGYPGVMVTDTALFRYPHYHLPSDTPDKLDYARMAQVVDAMRIVVERLASPN